MRKSDLSLVRKYIEGEDLGEVDIEELENDPEFMLSVIIESNDFKMYQFCSLDVKRNYDFVKGIIDKYRISNPDFVSEVAYQFICLTDDRTRAFEVGIFLNYNMACDSADGFNYFIMAKEAVDMSIIEACKSKQGEEQFKEEFKSGFIILLEQYESNEIITNYYARKFMHNIFEENDIDLTLLLHFDFRTKEEVSLVNPNEYVINIINSYDPYLADYLREHQELLVDISFDEIISKWDEYNEKDKIERVYSAVEMSERYLNEIRFFIIEEDLIDRVSEEFGVGELVSKYYSEFYPDYALEERISLKREVSCDVDKLLETDRKAQAAYSILREIFEEQLHSLRPKMYHEMFDDNNNLIEKKGTEKK